MGTDEGMSEPDAHGSKWETGGQEDGPAGYLVVCSHFGFISGGRG